MSGLRIKIDWKGIPETRRRLTSLQMKAPAALLTALRWEAGEIMQASLERVPKAFYQLSDSRFITISRGRVELGYNSPYALAQHEGVQAGTFPNWENLRPWAELKLGDERAAFPVAKKIFERGLPHPAHDNRKFLENPVKEALPGMPRRIIRRTEAIL